MLLSKRCGALYVQRSESERLRVADLGPAVTQAKEANRTEDARV